MPRKAITSTSRVLDGGCRAFGAEAGEGRRHRGELAVDHDAAEENQPEEQDLPAEPAVRERAVSEQGGDADRGHDEEEYPVQHVVRVLKGLCRRSRGAGHADHDADPRRRDDPGEPAQSGARLDEAAGGREFEPDRKHERERQPWHDVDPERHAQREDTLVVREITALRRPREQEDAEVRAQPVHEEQQVREGPEVDVGDQSGLPACQRGSLRLLRLVRRGAGSFHSPAPPANGRLTNARLPPPCAIQRPVIPAPGPMPRCAAGRARWGDPTRSPRRG